MDLVFLAGIQGFEVRGAVDCGGGGEGFGSGSVRIRWSRFIARKVFEESPQREWDYYATANQHLSGTRPLSNPISFLYIYI